MPNYFYPKDVYPIMNELCRQLSAQKQIAVVDTTSFVSVLIIKHSGSDPIVILVII